MATSIEQAFAGDPRSIGRLISLVEADSPSGKEIMKQRVQTLPHRKRPAGGGSRARPGPAFQAGHRSKGNLGQAQDVAHRAVCQQAKHLPQQGEGALVLRFHGLSAPFGGNVRGYAASECQKTNSWSMDV